MTWFLVRAIVVFRFSSLKENVGIRKDSLVYKLF